MNNNTLGSISSVLSHFKINIQLFVFITFLFISNVFAQTIQINPATDGGFEIGTTFTSNGWSTIGGSAIENIWHNGNGATAGFTGTRCAYISNTVGGAHAYTITTSRASFLYRNITIPSGESDITLSFNWMGRGESTYDRMRVWIIPTTSTLISGTELTSIGTAPTGNIQLGAANYSEQLSWTATSFKLPSAYAGTTVRLVFEWKNDASVGTQPPVAIDNISLTSRVLVTPANDLCANATNLPCGTTNLAGTTVATTNITNNSGCANMSNYGVWYTFLGDGNPTTISTNPSFDIKLSVATGTCGTMSNIACTDSSPETATFTTVSGTRYYVYVASYGNSSTTTGTFTISRSCQNSATYCIPTNTTNTTYYISGLTTTGGITNINNTPTGFTAGGYANYTALSVSQNAGLSFNIRASHPSSTYGYKVWIDWNKDGDFDDVGENVISTGYLNTPTSLGTVTIPLGQTPGNYRMRIRNAIYSNPPPACGEFVNGEAEDYTVTVISPLPCSGNPTAGTVTTSPNTAFSGSTYTVSATGFTNASGLTFQWQYSTNGGTTWVNAGSATTTYSNYNATAPATGNVQWHLAVTCTIGGQTTTSTTGVFVTIAVSIVATGCPNVVSGGLGLNGADPATITCVSASGCVDLEATYLDLGDTTSYIVEQIAYNPPFPFTGLANPISVNTDDVWSPTVNLPFDFCFYGNTYRRCLVSSNGVITFDLANNSPGGYSTYSFSNNIPSNNLFLNSIFGVYHDIDPSKGGQIGWELITLPTGCRALVAAWNNVPMYSENAILYTGMMVLYENSNVIEVYIKSKQIDNYNISPFNDGNAVIGIQNTNGTLATVPPRRNALDSNWSTTNEAWRFVPNGTSIASIKWHEGAGVSGPVVGTTDNITVCPTITTTYTAEITYTLCDGRTVTEVDQTTVTVNKDKVWNGSSNTNWNTAANWTPPGIPTAAQSVTIPNVINKPIISAGADALACSVTVESGGVLTINSGANIIVTNAVSVASGGAFNIKNSGSLIQINNASVNSGNIKMERITNVRLQDYSYWSSPVGTLGAGTFPVQSVSPLTPPGFIFKWGTTTTNANGGQGTWVNTNENMIPAKGYILRAPNGFTNTATSTLTANFIGTANNGIFSPTIYRGTDFTGNGSQSIPRTITDDNWNLVGNPYPSALGINEFLTLPANNTIVGGVRIWTHTQLPTNAVDPFYQNFVSNYYPNDYITINLTGSTSGPGDYKIGAGQGFMVLMNAGAPGSSTVTFNNAMRNASFANSQFYRNSSESDALDTIEQHRIWLDLVAPNGSTNRTLVGYITNATQEEDRLYDSFTDYKPSQNFYSLIGNDPMSIQGRALPFNVNDLVNLGITIPENGTYKIAISALDGLFETTNQNIYIEDTHTNIIHNLRENPYTFSEASGNNPNRFVLRYTNETLENDDFVIDVSSVWVSLTNELTVKSSKNEIRSVRVFDVLGREVANYPKVNSHEVPLTKIQKNNAGLIIQITLSNGAVISKKAIY